MDDNIVRIVLDMLITTSIKFVVRMRLVSKQWNKCALQALLNQTHKLLPTIKRLDSWIIIYLHVEDTGLSVCEDKNLVHLRIINSLPSCQPFFQKTGDSYDWTTRNETALVETPKSEFVNCVANAISRCKDGKPSEDYGEFGDYTDVQVIGN